MGEIKNMTLKESIYEKIKMGGVSFVELGQIEGFKGNLCLNSVRHPNLIFWTEISEEATDALDELTKENKITISPTSALVYMCDGAMPKLPIAKPRQRVFKNPTWVPIVFNAVTEDNGQA